MANWEKLIEEHYEKKNKFDLNEVYKLVDEALARETNYQGSGAIEGHASKRLSTKGKVNKDADPFNEDPPKKRSKSAPAGFGALEEAEDLEEAALNRKDLFKRNNLKTFLSKVDSGEPFELMKGGEIVIDPKTSEEFLAALRNGEAPASNSKLYSVDGKRFGLGSLKKTDQFGGRGSEHFVAKEIAARGQLDDLIKKAIAAANTEAITLRVLDKSGSVLVEYDDVVSVVDQDKVKGVDPKSDFRLIRKDGKPDVHISHKDGKSPKDMQNWAGVGPKSGFSDHPELVKFGEDLKQHMVKMEDGSMSFPPKTTIARKIESEDLKYKAIFGPNYSPSGPGSADNVDLVAQGVFSLSTDGVESQDGEPQVVYNLGAHHLLSRIGFDGDFGADYQPIITARYTSGRASFGIKNARGLIYPISGRKINKYI